ncbi:MAG: type II toxin-antitoxin system Phd/YefM family antitoxin [Vicinamibacterales bacterium]
MAIRITATALRASLPGVVERVRKGARFTVTYRRRPVFEIVPVGEAAVVEPAPLDADPLYEAGAVGSSNDGRTAADHDEALYRP